MKDYVKHVKLVLVKVGNVTNGYLNNLQFQKKLHKLSLTNKKFVQLAPTITVVQNTTTIWYKNFLNKQKAGPICTVKS